MFLQERIEEINSNLRILEKASHIAVWGAGVHTVNLFEKTELLSYKINFVLDMDEKKQGRFFFGWRIQSPQKIDWKEIDAVVVSVPNHESDIVDMLKRDYEYMGIIVTMYGGKANSTPFYKLYDAMIPAIRYQGDYGSWEEAAAECLGYDDLAIVSKVIDSIEKVRRGEAAWERDSWLFMKDKYTYKICASILRCAVHNKGQRVRVLDIGGSLGSTWFQNRKYLSGLIDIEYIVAEQDCFAEYGHENLEDGTLKFIRSTDRWEDTGKFDVILLSASLQYIPSWEEIINRIILASPRYVVLDRLLVSDRRRICVETVPEIIYPGSYPVVIFDKGKIENLFGNDYCMIEDDESSVYEEAWFIDGMAESRFYVFECRKEKWWI